MDLHKIKLKYWVKIIAILFIISFTTGIIKFPIWSKLLGETYFNLPLGGITLLHDWASLIMGILITVHLILHKDLIKEMAKKGLKKQK